MPVLVKSLDQEARGIARHDGKAVFIDGALPGELVEYSVFRKKPNHDLANVTRVARPSFMRVCPKCANFGTCGGCNMQHLDPGAQVAIKQRILEDSLARIGKLNPEVVLPAIHGAAWNYRYRARLAVRHVEKKGGVLIGFHEKHSSFIADMTSCEILPPQISGLLGPLRELIAQLTIRRRVPQIEVACGEAVTALVLRVLDPLVPADEVMLRHFAERHSVQFWLQPRGPESAYPFHPLDAPELNYTLPEFNLVIPFHPTEFTQINPTINRVLVGRAVALLTPEPGERIADLFCGLGNFSLALARRGAHVVGLEVNPALVKRAAANAQRNGVASHAQFHVADLYQETELNWRRLGNFNKMLIDPPRDGAIQVVKALDERAPTRILYVSCNPSTLARDAAVLVHAKDYMLRAVGVINMFPHTAHVESIALFER